MKSSVDSDAVGLAAGRVTPRLLHGFIDEPVRRWPNQVAVEVPAGEGRPFRSLTYGELARQSRLLAGRIAARAGVESFVAILLSRETPDLFVAQLGVMQAGAAYVCIDPALPDDYARFLIEDTAAALLVTDAAGVRRAATLGVDPARVLEIGGPEATGAPAATALPQIAPENLAYVIYTSGTTGRPKGVLIEHRSIANLVEADRREYGIGPGDRVAQNSSPSYDSSIEEIWLALATGATLVVVDEATVRAGPDLAQCLKRERITVFCPPPTLLRTLGCREPAKDLPDLRMVYVGGEALPEDVAALWSPACRLENGYGPTECAVTATRVRTMPGAPITIGTPIPGNVVWVLDEELREVPEGEVGELCLGGIGLARGYHNRPELTAERFPTHPKLGRLYRSGDLVRRNSDGALIYLGRRDSQVKVRGHRIELEAIEARLAELPGVRTATCRVQGEGTRKVVVAFVVPVDSATPPDLEGLRSALAVVLPAPMVPARIGLLDRVPTTLGGKVDRKRLPELELAAHVSGLAVPLEGLEARLAECFGVVLGRGGAVGRDDDFFNDFGGDSLAAAELISRLREIPETAGLTVRNLYECRSVRALAERCRTAPEPAQRRAAARPVNQGRLSTWPMTMAQGGWMLMEGLALAACAQYAVFDLLPLLIESLGLVGALLVAPLIAFLASLLWAPFAVAGAVAAKRLLIGRYQPGWIPAWSGRHFRHWLVARAARRIPWRLFSGTGLTSVVLRLLGARVGQRVHFHRGVDLARGGWDLLEIGDDVTLSQDAAVRTVELFDGGLAFGSVRLESGCTLETRAGVGRDCVVGQGAHLKSLSWLEVGTRIPDGEVWDGVPARRVGVVSPPPPIEGEEISEPAHATWLLGLRPIVRLLPDVPLILLVFAALAFGGIDTARIADWLRHPGYEPRLFMLVFAVLILRVPAALLVEALLVRALCPPGPQVVARRSLSYARIWLAVEQVNEATRWLSGTLLWPRWLRLAGMRIGRNCEISTLIDLVPSLVEIGDETFMADGIYLGGPRLHAGRVVMERTVIGRDTFVGNHAVIPAGARLPAGVLVGVCTPADPRVVRRSGVWFGHPPFELVHQPVTDFDRSVTHEPGAVRRFTRWFWELLRFVMPVPVAALGLLWLGLGDALAAEADGIRAVLAVAVATLVTAVVAWLAVVVLKWGLLGRVQPGRHPLWSCWCCRWDFLYVAWEQLALGVLSELEGTLFLNASLRAFGMRIGKGVLLGSGFAQVVDPDMLTFEDGATVTGNFQAHTFEDRVLKIGPVVIRKNATVGSNSVLFYGADIGAGARVAPHGVVLKGERLTPGRDFAGVPTQPV